jgi:hypothetical protein
MEEKDNLNITSFKIVFNNQILQIDYDTSFEEYQTKTIDSVIQEVINKLGQKPLTKTSKDYILVCSCGRTYNPNKLLSQAKCPHYTESDFDKEKNKNEKFILYEKPKEEKYNSYLTNNEIEKLLKEVTGAKKLIKLKGVIPKEQRNNDITFSDNLKNKIKELITKKDRGIRIIANDFSLKYSEQIYNELLEFGMANNIIKASLRITNNDKEAALLLATDTEYNWENKDYLFYDNSEVLSVPDFNRLCREEVNKEFPSINDDEEILYRVKTVINLVSKNNNEINSSEDNKNDSDYNEEDEDNDDSSEENVDESDSNLGSHIFEF